ncbi:hypothetical protein [Microbacterium sp. YY-01]|uniref:hypothetical protein n=1 Tax=Microbacterium sp. YY-01 TaxID=3421634 RepID=UPI003D186566
MKHLAHATDPATSHDAVVALNQDNSAALKDALLHLLAEKPMTADELTTAYTNRAEFKRWPIFTDWHNIKRRLSELHTHHKVIRPSGHTRPSRMGRKSIVWELSLALDEARIIVGSGKTVE